MKKDEIIRIRVVSVAVLMAALALILIFGAGSGVFSKIIKEMSGADSQMDAVSASIYNLVFYRGMNVCYELLFGAAISVTVIAAAGIIIKIKGTDICLRAAVVTDTVIGIFLVLSFILEKNVFLHRIFAKIYLGVFDATAEGERQLGVHVLIAGILIVVLAMLSHLLIKSSGILKMTAYKSDKNQGKFIVLPVIYAVLVIDAIREWALSVSSGLSSLSGQIYEILRDYYFEGRFLLDMPKWIFVLAAVLITIVITAFLKSYVGKSFSVLLGVLFAGIAAVRCVVFAFNLPALFGVVSLDEKVCSMTDTAGYAYIVLFVFDVFFLTVLSVLCLINAQKKILIIALGHAVISIALIFILGFAGIAAVYAGCAAADVLASVGLLYVVYTGSGNH